MARGRKPTPTPILMLRSSKRVQARQDEVQPPPAPLTPPSWLSGSALEHWEQTAPLLMARGLLTELDVIAWSLACGAFADFLMLRALVAQEGVIVSTARDGRKTHPAARLLLIVMDQYFRVAREFGCTPSARVGLTVQPLDTAPSGDERFFRR